MSIRLTALAMAFSLLCGVFAVTGCSKNSVGGDEVMDDGIGPAAITDLEVASFSDSSITLIWTASGDDSLTGTAASYDLRMSFATISWDNFDSATQISGLPAPASAGQAEQFIINGLETDSTYYFSLRVFDENGNFNGASNCVHATCFNDFSVTIPDPALLAAIRLRINKPTGDILKSDLNSIFDLLIADQSIADLTGLEYCDNLGVLNIINNSIHNLSPLSSLTKLAQLHAGQNSISDISSLTGLPGLEWLRLNANQISDLTPLAGLTHLTDLDLQNNQIRDVTALTGLVQLEGLSLSSNYIRDISPLISNGGLGTNDDITLSFNPLNHESIYTHIPALRGRGATVHWVENTLPPGDILDLAVDTVSENSVTLSWTAPGEDFNIGIAYKYELRYSTIQSAVANWTGGQQVSGLPDPDSAGTSQSMIVSGLLKDTTYYFALRTQDNSEHWSAVSNVVWGRPYSDEVVLFPDAALEGAVRIAIAKPTGDIFASDLLALDSLIANNLGISDLSGLEYCANLSLLHLIDNNISQIGQLEHLIALHDINLQGNNISDLSPLAGLGNLIILQVSDNPITGIDDLSSLGQLWFLAMNFNSINDIQPLASMTHLQYLLIVGNSISDISPLSNCTHLKYLIAGHNGISDISTLESLVELDNVALQSNSIQDISPLVSNVGLSSGDQVTLDDNPLSQQSIDVHIPALQARGVTVTY